MDTDIYNHRMTNVFNACKKRLRLLNSFQRTSEAQARSNHKPKGGSRDMIRNGYASTQLLRHN